MPSDKLEVIEFSPESMRRIAEQIRRVEAMYQNLLVELSRIRYGDPKTPRNFVMEATATVAARSGETVGTGTAKILRKLDGDLSDYKPDANNLTLKTVNNFTTSGFGIGDEFLALEDAFANLWAIPSSLTLPPTIAPFQINANERLDPGESALATLLEFDGNNWVLTAETSHILHDRFYRNFLVAGERCWARKTPSVTPTGTGTGTGPDAGWDVLGENGLKRTAVATSQIQASASGNVEIYSGPVTTFGLPTCTRSATGVIVNACVLPASSTVEIGDVLHILYHPDHFKWIVTKKFGASAVVERIAYGYLADSLCPTPTGTGTGVGDEYLTDVLVEDIRYVDGTVPSPSSDYVRNSIRVAGDVGDFVWLVRVGEQTDTGTGTGTASAGYWDILNIEHKRTKVMTGWRYDGQARIIWNKYRFISVPRCGDEFEEVADTTQPC